MHRNRASFAIAIANVHCRPEIAAISGTSYTLTQRNVAILRCEFPSLAIAILRIPSKVALFKTAEFPFDFALAMENRCDCDLRFWCAQIMNEKPAPTSPQTLRRGAQQLSIYFGCASSSCERSG